MSASFELKRTGAGQFALNGVLGFPTATALLKCSDTLFADAPAEIKVDLAGVTQADSAGLALLIEWLARASQRQRQVCYSNLPAQIRAVARISEVEDFLSAATVSPGRS